ncbi:hypothetical protein WDZ92_32020, partial [Nostoc sp. NIES-2111]
GGGKLPSEVYYEAFQRNYHKAQYLWVQFSTEWLSAGSRAFGGDLQLMLILALIGQVTLERAVAANGNVDDLTRTGINASRISDVTGIPRETVRRKLLVLEKRNWIEQDGNANWSIKVVNGQAPVRAELASLEEFAIRGVTRFVAAFEPLSRS